MFMESLTTGPELENSQGQKLTLADWTNYVSASDHSTDIENRTPDVRF
jgi:hypothetical protein